MIETKSRQNMVFDPAGLSGCPCGCPFWEGDALCIVGGWLGKHLLSGTITCVFLVFSMYQDFPESNLNSGPEPRPYI